MKKEERIWFSSDTWNSWYLKGKINQYNSLVEEGTITEEQNTELDKLNNILSISIRVDTFFIHILYLLSAIGLFFRKRESIDDIYNFIVIVILGWIAVFMFAEVQSRYRCHAMPMFMILGSLGINTVFNIMTNYFNRIKKLLNR